MPSRKYRMILETCTPHKLLGMTYTMDRFGHSCMGKPIREFATGMETEQTSPGKISTEPQNMDTALSLTRSALKLPKITRARPPPEDSIAEPDPDIKTKTTD